ncbi:MAG: type II toxin-antitoxin system PemK/MazF family toxin [Pirellulales bacterium]
MKRADVVLVDFPYSDGTGSKLRPALVVQADFLNGLINDTVLVSITRTVRPASQTEALIEISRESRSGLRHDSVVTCTNFITMDQALVYRTIGALSKTTMDEVDRRLRTALAL